MTRTLALVDQEKAHHAASRLCRVLGVPRASYYAWKGHRPSPRAVADAELTERIRRIHKASRGTYGAPRIHAELRLGEGVCTARKRVARLLRAAGLQGRHWRRRHQTTRRDPKATAAPDLVERNFTAERPDALWMGDFTELPTGEGVLYVAALLDGCSRACVGWSMRTDRTAELVTGALGMAVARRGPARGLVHHSDHGSPVHLAGVHRSAGRGRWRGEHGLGRGRAGQRRLRELLWDVEARAVGRRSGVRDPSGGQDGGL